MTSYEGFSSLYDAFMQDAPYDDWMSWLTREIPLGNLSVADIGCGTGVLTRRLSAHCQSVMGVDISEDMLARALEQAFAEELVIPWLCQDMRMLRLPHPVHLAISSCDCVNYLTSAKDVKQCFSAIYDNLADGGWFCFDVLGPERIQTLQQGFWYDLQDDAAVLFETMVDEETGEVLYDVHAFVQQAGGLYRRVQEQHRQQFHTVEALTQALEQCGFEICEILGDFGRRELSASDRWAIICKKPSKVYR